MSFSPCAIVPSCNHYFSIQDVVSKLRDHNLFVLIIDDGSVEPAKTFLERLHNPSENVYVHRLEENKGKGSAVLAGFKLANAFGYTHGIQVDADGQHDMKALPTLLGLAKKYPGCLISGQRVYDDTVPFSRMIGCWLTHIWVWIETLSFQISDSMCGYRVYPLLPSLKVAEEEYIGRRMDFDTEIMVRLYWRAIPVIMTPVRVTYPRNNFSNFHVFLDNWRITKMHTRLVLGMLCRFPKIIKNHPEETEIATHWIELEERGMYLGLRFVAFIYRVMGRRVCIYLIQPILLFFFLTGRKQRAASLKYWRQITSFYGLRENVSLKRSFMHFRSFGQMAVDKFAAWMGDITLDDLIIQDEEKFDQIVKSGKGVLLLVSHLGNIEICRALSRKRDTAKITVLVHTKHALRFNQILSCYNPDASLDMVQVSEMGPSTAIELQERLERGEWVAIAGDRSPVFGQKRVTNMQFLGAEAPFSEGAIVLASIFKVPVYMMLCVKEENKFRMIFEKLTEQVILPRKDQTNSISKYLKSYTDFLERNCKKYPDQWYNFFDFWTSGK